MVKLLGHLAMGLLFALPAWVFWDGRTSVAFVVFVLTTTMLPDLDLVLADAGLPVEHHGVLHTVVFVVIAAAIAGLVVEVVFRPLLKRWWRMTEDETVRRGTLYLFVAGGMALGGVSHLFADALGSDAHQPISPFWPVYDETITFEIGHFASPWLNAGLLVVAVVLHALIASYGAFPVEHRFRAWTEEVAPEDSDGSRSL